MTVNHSREGYLNADGTGISYEGLASTDFNIIPISIDPASRDVGNPDGSTHLRPYLAMGYDTSSDRYQPFNSAVHEDSTIVVLAKGERDINVSSVNGQPASVNSIAFIRATFKSGVVIEPTSVTWADVQRLIIRDNV